MDDDHLKHRNDKVWRQVNVLSQADFSKKNINIRRQQIPFKDSQHDPFHFYEVSLKKWIRPSRSNLTKKLKAVAEISSFSEQRFEFLN